MPSADPEHLLARQIGLYLHVPFCRRKCPYCSFFSEIGSSRSQRRYAAAVRGQLDQVIRRNLPEGVKVATIFVGGGTPSVLGPELLASLLAEIRRGLTLHQEEIETSLEVNPATIAEQQMTELRRGGYNRISIGIQSLDDRELQVLGRIHSAREGLQAVAAARRAGFERINIDLMYGLPGQSRKSWNETLQKALELQPDHLAIYELTIEDGTPFAERMQQGGMRLPTEDEIIAMAELTEQTTAAAGLPRYEISNYARPGMECRHNINYWRNGWYLGLGPGAVSCLAGKRYTAVPDVEEFCRRIETAERWWSELEELDNEARFRETVIMGLRMTEGLLLKEMNARFGLDVITYYGEILAQLERQGLVRILPDRLCLTRKKGMLLANQVLRELV